MVRLTASEPTKPFLNIQGPPEIGTVCAWVPEAISTNTGCTAVYPLGEPWKEEGGVWSQHVPESTSCGPGNCDKVDANNFECCGIRIPHDGRVSWDTRAWVSHGGEAVEFVIRLTNTGRTRLRQAGAAVCVKFLDRSWWSDPNVLVRSGGAVRSLAELGRDAGQPNGFQGYLLAGQAWDHVFFREFWGFNKHRLDLPVMVSQNVAAGWCVAVEAPRAYMLHSNPGNPCTDMMLALGDLAPGETGEAFGRISFHRRTAQALLA